MFAVRDDGAIAVSELARSYKTQGHLLDFVTLDPGLQDSSGSSNVRRQPPGLTRLSLTRFAGVQAPYVS